MAAPFGFSAGDIAMAIKFTASVVNALKETGGAASEYQQAFEYWKGLLVSYQHLQHLHAYCLDPTLLDEIRGLAVLTEEPIHAYIKRIHAEFGTAMQLNARDTQKRISVLLKKAKWAIHSSAKDEKLRMQMSARLQTMQLKFDQIHMIGIDRANEEISKLRQHQIDSATEQQSFNATLLNLITSMNHKITQNVSHNGTSGIVDQTATPVSSVMTTELIPTSRNSSSLAVRRLFNMNSDSARGLGIWLTRVLSYFLQNAGEVLQVLYPLLRSLFVLLYSAMTELPRSLSLTGAGIIKFEDGLGRVFNLPYQWFQTWHTFEGFLLDQFKGVAGERYVLKGHYNLLNPVHCRLIRSSSQGWSKSVFPGAKIAMSMVIIASSLQFLECPKFQPSSAGPATRSTQSHIQTTPCVYKNHTRKNARMNMYPNLYGLVYRHHHLFHQPRPPGEQCATMITHTIRTM
ncbi:hypothetical protein K505DRAFT_415400 [Melanomma pulvis-pyrius CBS 109.77]|uniref:Ubiquitin-like domain-containing protein n=1 Tax=Melanomma pulvis-pyrius CBS 109.77 TaxID=1314802 RepID=A0A6A6XL89_9PLEO|nr:hypothetical protein K505DRAFT_415400 [Melanomma pulvis-pyrius CBS 109.77]